MNRIIKKLYSAKEIRNAFSMYFYGSGGDYFFPHPKIDKTSKKECKDVVKMRYNEFLEILNSRKGRI